MNVKRMLGVAMMMAALTLIGRPVQAAIISDIILIVDESGSMGDVQANLRTNIGTFAAILAAGGVDARFGLVGYGNNSIRPRMLTDLTDPAGFATAAQGLSTNGGTEPGYSGVAFGLNAIDGQSALFSFRPGALKNLILFTDEPSNGDNCNGCLTGGNATTLADVNALLAADTALFNAVLREPSTINSYGALATGHGGHVYDLNGLNTSNQSVVQQFVLDFSNSKLQETRDFCTLNPTAPACQGVTVPEPASMALFSIAAGAAAMRRRRTRA